MKRESGYYYAKNILGRDIIVYHLGNGTYLIEGNAHRFEESKFQSIGDKVPSCEEINNDYVREALDKYHLMNIRTRFSQNDQK